MVLLGVSITVTVCGASSKVITGHGTVTVETAGANFDVGSATSEVIDCIEMGTGAEDVDTVSKIVVGTTEVKVTTTVL